MSALVLAALLSIAAAPVVASPNLSAMGWEMRVLVIFGTEHDAEFAEQRRLLEAHAAGLEDRDMLVVGVVGDRIEPIFGDTLPVDAATLRRQLAHDGDDFAIVLLGKDGGVKLRQDQPIAPAELFAFIDAMPVRRTEMSGEG